MDAWFISIVDHGEPDTFSQQLMHIITESLPLNIDNES